MNKIYTIAIATLVLFGFSGCIPTLKMSPPVYCTDKENSKIKIEVSRNSDDTKAIFKDRFNLFTEVSYYKNVRATEDAAIADQNPDYLFNTTRALLNSNAEIKLDFKKNVVIYDENVYDCNSSLAPLRDVLLTPVIK